MRLHLAAAYWNEMRPGQKFFEMLPPHQKAHVDAPYLLESYHYLAQDKLRRILRDNKKRIFIDSGAFTALTMGVTIDLPEYCRFIQEFADVIEVASVLDVIGSAEGTWDNQQRMERLGVKPIPCFHYGEDMRWCDYYAANYEYIALGGVAIATRPELRSWFDEVWEKHLTDGAGRPKCKVHGFAVTSIPLMQRYPWYSVDSSGWVQISSVGYVRHPLHGLITIGSNSSNRKIEGQHYDNLPPIMQYQLTQEFNALGYDLDDLRNNYHTRRAYCMWAYQEINRNIDRIGKTFVNQQTPLF
jgi:hypothetical protein